MKQRLAAADLILVAPGVVFFLALFLRNFFPPSDPGNAAQSIVMWYAGRPWTLWILLVGLPLVAVLVSAVVLVRLWSRDDSLRKDATQAIRALRTHHAAALTAASMISAVTVLFLVALHMAAN